MRASRWSTVLSLLVCACGPAVITPTDDASGPTSDGWPTRADAIYADAAPCEDVVDVVFVLDTSGSMGFVLDDLASNIAGVVDAANALAPDAHFGFIGFQDNHRLDDTGPLEGGVVHTGATTLSAAFQRFVSTYTDANRNPGDGPSGPMLMNPLCEEDSLDALYAAAADFPWRATATRVIILVTDDTFLDGGDNYGDQNGDGDTSDWYLTPVPGTEADYPARHTLAETMALLATQRVRVFTFTKLAPPTPCAGNPRRLADSHVSDGWSTPKGELAPIPDETDARNFDLDAVAAGTLSLAETISQVVVESYCNPIL